MFSIPFDVIQRHIKYYYPEVGEYIRKIRSGIGGRGPKMAEICDVLDSENFDWNSISVHGSTGTLTYASKSSGC